jgi:hypothetical protein
MARETGWLIEDEDHFPKHRWLRAIKYVGDEKGTVEWTEDANLAIRFARRRDAVDFAWLFPNMTVMALITEHVFDDGAAQETFDECDHDWRSGPPGWGEMCNKCGSKR